MVPVGCGTMLAFNLGWNQIRSLIVFVANNYKSLPLGHSNRAVPLFQTTEDGPRQLVF